MGSFMEEFRRLSARAGKAGAHDTAKAGSTATKAAVGTEAPSFESAFKGQGGAPAVTSAPRPVAVEPRASDLAPGPRAAVSVSGSPPPASYFDPPGTDKAGVLARALGGVRSVSAKAARGLAWAAGSALGKAEPIVAGVLGRAAPMIGTLMIGDAALIVGKDMLARKVFGSNAIDIQNLAATGSASVMPHAASVAAAGVAAYALGKVAQAPAMRGVIGSTIGRVAGRAGRAGTALAGIGTVAGLAGSVQQSMPILGMLESVMPSAVAASKASPSFDPAATAAGQATPAAPTARSTSWFQSAGQARAADAAAFPEDDRFIKGGPLRSIDAGTSLQIGGIDGRARAGNLALGVGARAADQEAARPVAYSEGMRADGSSYFMMGRREPGADGRIVQSFVAEAGPSGSSMSASKAFETGNGFVNRTVRSFDPSLAGQSDAAMNRAGAQSVVLNRGGQNAAQEMGTVLSEKDQVSSMLESSGLRGLRAQSVQTVAAGNTEASTSAKFSGLGADGRPVSGAFDLVQGRGRISVNGEDGKPAWSSQLETNGVAVDRNGTATLSGRALEQAREFMADPSGYRGRNPELSPEKAFPDQARSPAPSPLTPVGLASPRFAPRVMDGADASSASSAKVETTMTSARGATLNAEAAASLAAGRLPSRTDVVGSSEALVEPVSRLGPVAASQPARDPLFSAGDGRTRVATASVPVDRLPAFSASDRRIAAGSDALGVDTLAPQRSIGVAEGLLPNGGAYFVMGVEDGKGSQRLSRSVAMASLPEGGAVSVNDVVSGPSGSVSRSLVSTGPGLVSVAPSRDPAAPPQRAAMSQEGADRIAELSRASRELDPVSQGLVSGSMNDVRGRVVQASGTDAHTVASFAGKGKDGKQIAGSVEFSEGHGRMVVYGPDGVTPVWAREMDGKGIHLNKTGAVSVSGPSADQTKAFLSDPQGFREKSGEHYDQPRPGASAPSSFSKPVAVVSAPATGLSPPSGGLPASGAGPLTGAGVFGPTASRPLSLADASGRQATGSPSRADGALVAWSKLGSDRFRVVDEPAIGRGPASRRDQDGPMIGPG